MTHPLDRPAWSALRTRHAALAEGGALARRYPADVAAFAACGEDAPESLAALEGLVRPGQSVVFLQAGEVRLPDGLRALSVATGVQMTATDALPPAPAGPVERLTRADAAEMLELALLTKPGPFTLRVQDLGGFWGVRIEGRIAAMAGERMAQPGFTELSGVCTHPDFRGGGLGRLLSLYVANQIRARGETPYLHAYLANTAAIDLYGSIGFSPRCEVQVVVAER